jgi:hypothetical protein
MSSLETPMGLALLVCDTVIEDRLTGKKTLVGLFDRVHAPSLPWIHPTMNIFVSLTGGRGQYPCEVVCRNADESTVAFSAKGNVALRDPRQVVDLIFRLAGVRFEKTGMYWVHFLVDAVPIMMRPLIVQEPPRGKPKGEQTPE